MEVKGLRELEIALRELPAEVERTVLRQALAAGARVVRDEARARVPVRAEASLKGYKIRRSGFLGQWARATKGRLPGFLRASIVSRVVRAGGGLVAKVGWTGDAFYGMFLEFGTSRIAARPFLRPAFEAVKARAVAEIAAKLGPGIEKAAAKLGRRR
jgi:HK97 gp10 family phage protein